MVRDASDLVVREIDPAMWREGVICPIAAPMPLEQFLDAVAGIGVPIVPEPDGVVRTGDHAGWHVVATVTRLNRPMYVLIPPEALPMLASYRADPEDGAG